LKQERIFKSDYRGWNVYNTSKKLDEVLAEPTTQDGVQNDNF